MLQLYVHQDPTHIRGSYTHKIDNKKRSKVRMSKLLSEHEKLNTVKWKNDQMQQNKMRLKHKIQ